MSPVKATATARFHTLCDLHHTGVSIMRERFRLEHPELSEIDIERRLCAWLGRHDAARQDGPDYVWRKPRAIGGHGG